MSERVGVVGSRQGADLEHVRDFLVALRAKHPDTILVSGGAEGVDKEAEATWLRLGGQVESLRVKEIDVEDWGVEMWELGGAQPRVYMLIQEPTWQDWKSAIHYRDLLIAERADRLVAFFKPGRSRGAGFTAEMSRNYDKPTYEYERTP